MLIIVSKMANTYHLTFAYLSKNQTLQSIRIHTAIKVEYKRFAFYKNGRK